MRGEVGEMEEYAWDRPGFALVGCSNHLVASNSPAFASLVLDGAGLPTAILGNFIYSASDGY